MSIEKNTPTPGPWRWQGEDYRGGWGWQMLVGPNGEGLIVGQGRDGRLSPLLRAHQPIDPSLAITGLIAAENPHADPVHVFGEANARQIVRSPELFALLVESQTSIGGDWRERRDAVIAEIRGEK